MAYTRFPPAQPDAGAPPPEDTTPAAAAPADAAPDTRPLSLLAVIFLVSCFIPLMPYNLGGLALTPARMVMLVMCVPLLIMMMMGKAGRIRMADILMAGFVIWMVVTFLAYGGTDMLTYSGISVIEFLTPYLMARCFVRSPAQYQRVLQICFAFVVLLAFTSALEAIANIRILSRIFDVVGTSYPPVPERYDRRLGMLRAQGVFVHPIHYGVVMSLFLAPFFYMLRKSGGIGGARRAIWSAVATFFSLSTGAWLSLSTQMMIVAWGRIFKGKAWRWKALIVVSILAYIVVDIGSNRTPFEVFVSYMTLNTGTAFMRVLIFSFGMENVWANPIFGIGLGEWTRPSWMHSSSVDNFWLLTAMRHGIPGFLLCAGFYFAMIVQMGRAKIADPAVAQQRNALVFALIGVALSACTVHLWGTALYVVLFMLGCGGWMADQGQAEASAAPQAGRAGAKRAAGRTPDRPSRPVTARQGGARA